MQNFKLIKETIKKNAIPELFYDILIYVWFTLFILNFFYNYNTLIYFWGLFYLKDLGLNAVLGTITVILVAFLETIYMNALLTLSLSKRKKTLVGLIFIYLITEIFISVHCRELGISLGFISPW